MSTTLSTADLPTTHSAAHDLVSELFDTLDEAPSTATQSAVARPLASLDTPSRDLAPISLFGAKIDPLTMGQAVQRILGWTRAGEPCRYVVTPNVDHCVMLAESPAFQATYRDAALVLADESTGNLDPQLAVDILGLFEDLHRAGTTVLFATHDRSLLEASPHRTLVLDDGRIHDIGAGSVIRASHPLEVPVR